MYLNIFDLKNALAHELLFFNLEDLYDLYICLNESDNEKLSLMSRLFFNCLDCKSLSSCKCPNVEADPEFCRRRFFEYYESRDSIVLPFDIEDLVVSNYVDEKGDLILLLSNGLSYKNARRCEDPGFYDNP